MKHVFRDSRFYALALLAACSLQQTTLADKPFTAPLADGTRIAAIGDSITHGGPYHSYVHLYHITRFPQNDVQMLNAGISGDSAGGTVQRYVWDVEPLNANAATIMLGMNDVAGGGLYVAGDDSEETRQKRLQRVDAYERNMRALVERLLADGIRPALITPSIYDETSTMASGNEPGRNWSLGQVSQRVRAMAAEYDLPLIDFHGPMSELSLKLQAQNPEFTIVGKDRVHPGTPGHMAMAYFYLKAIDAPADVARISIDARSGTVTEQLRSSVRNIRRNADGIEFDYLAEAIPFPIDTNAQPALEWLPITDELNREILTVTDLPQGRYRLAIDGGSVRDYSASELASGVNLALENTPQQRQARQVLDLYNSTYRAPVAKLRAIAFVEHATSRSLPRPLTLEQVKPRLETWIENAAGKPYQGYFRKSAAEYLENKPQEDALRTAAAEAMPQIRSAAQPQPHTFTLTRID